MRITGIIIIIVGIIAGALIFYGAYLLWPYFVEYMAD